MKKETAEEEHHHARMVDRLLMFNDAVFAIALTLLVLELKFPEGEECHSVADMGHCLKMMVPKFLAFLLSAILVGGNWISAVNLQRLLVKYDYFWLVDMVIYLIIISLMPFCCYLIGTYPDNPWSFVVFGLVSELLIVNAFFFIRHCRMKKLFHHAADVKEIIRLEKSLLLLIPLVASVVFSAFYSTRLSFGLFLFFNLIPFFATRALKLKDAEAKQPG